MTYLFLSIMILGGLVAMGWLISAVMKDLRDIERDEKLDDIGGKPVMSDKELREEIDKWRSGK